MRKEYYGAYALMIPFVILLIAIFATAAHPFTTEHVDMIDGADVEAGRLLMQQYGCGSCHVIPGVFGADGTVGPALTGLATRSYLAGQLRNTPQNLIQWIRFPQELQAGVDMPDLGVSDSEARDMAAYLYQLK